MLLQVSHGTAFKDVNGTMLHLSCTESHTWTMCKPVSIKIPTHILKKTR